MIKVHQKHLRYRHEIYPKIIDRELALLTKHLFAVKNIPSI